MSDVQGVRGRYPDETWGERRRLTRYDDGRLIHVDGKPGATADLSLGGARVRMRHAPSVGEVVEVEFRLANVDVRALAVVRSADGPEVGIQFVWVPSRSTEMLRDDLTRRPVAAVGADNRG